MNNPDRLPRAAQRVADALAALGHDAGVRILSDTARSAAEAAAALGVGQHQIVKSLVFRGARSGQPILALVGGTSRVDTDRLRSHVGEPVTRAQADWVREQVGFAIGGIPPLPHVATIRRVADRSLTEPGELWAAAGTPHAVFRLDGTELVALTAAEVADIAETGPTGR